MSQWISIKDRRPPRMVTVLFCITRNKSKDVICGWDEADTEECDLCPVPCEKWIDMDEYEIIYWMPLPEPPQED